MVKKLLPWVLGAFLVIFIVTNSSGAAKVFKALGQDIFDIFSGFGQFISHLVS